MPFDTQPSPSTAPDDSPQYRGPQFGENNNEYLQTDPGRDRTYIVYRPPSAQYPIGPMLFGVVSSGPRGFEGLANFLPAGYAFGTLRGVAQSNSVYNAADLGLKAPA